MTAWLYRLEADAGLVGTDLAGIESVIREMNLELVSRPTLAAPIGPDGIAKEDEPAFERDISEVMACYPKSVPDWWFDETDAQGWPRQPPFFPQKTVITADAIWRPAPGSEREAYFTDYCGHRLFITMGFLAHRFKTCDEWQAFVGGLPVGRYSTMEEAFAAAIGAAKKKTEEASDVSLSQDCSGDSSLASGQESRGKDSAQAQPKESSDFMGRYLDRVCEGPELEEIPEDAVEAPALKYPVFSHSYFRDGRRFDVYEVPV